mgnify:CR=1 FL=1
MQEEEQTAEPIENETQQTAEPEAPGQEADVKAVEQSEEETERPRRLRRFLVWTVGLLLLFALGVVAAWFLQIKPMREQNRVLQIDLAEAQQTVDSLTSEVEILRPLEAENEALEEQVAELESHIFLLDVLVDVSEAQLALVEEDPIAAKDALQGTAERLQQLEERLSGANAETVRGMSERLALALEEVETDEFAARRDLEILANNLIALEQRLFGE